MSKQRLQHFVNLSNQAADADELVAMYRRALQKIGFQRQKRAPKNRWDAAQYLFHQFYDSFLRLQRKSAETATKSGATAVKLSVRELEVVRRSAGGLTRQEVARAIGMSYHTVDFHVRNILRKLDASNMLMAASKAQHLGLIAFEPRKSNVKLKARRERALKRKRALDRRLRAALQKMSSRKIKR